MDKQQEVNAIPRDIALRLCAEIRQDNRGKWNLAALQCRFCRKFSKKDPAKMCIFSRPGNRGCNLVNARYGQQRWVT